FEHGRKGKGIVADLRPQARHYHLLAAILLERVAHLLVVPRVHRRPLEDRRLGKYRQQFGVRIPRETLSLDRGDNGRNRENPGGLRQAYDVVLQRLPVYALHAERHLRLLINEYELAVVRSQYF